MADTILLISATSVVSLSRRCITSNVNGNKDKLLQYIYKLTYL